MKKLFLSLMMLAACAIGMSADELTVANGINTNSGVPFNGLYADTQNTRSQVLYHADSLVAIPAGATITGVKFYVSGNGVTFSGARYQYSMGEVDASEYPAYGATPFTGLSVVSENASNPPAGQLEITLDFDQPYEYQGGNLVFETLVIQTGNYSSTSWYGVNTPTSAGYTSLNRSSSQRFIPKTTFIYEVTEQPYRASVTPNALDFGKVTPNSEKELTVTLHNSGTNAFTPAISGLVAPFSTTYQPAELLGGSSVEIPVKFAPTEEGDFSGELVIDCGEAGTFTVSLNGIATTELDFTVCDGTLTSTEHPYKGTYTDTQGSLSQMIYNATMLTDAKDKMITAIKFYSSKDLVDVGATLQVSVGETDINAYERETAISVPDNLLTEDDLTVVASVSLPDGGREWEIVFDEPFEYKGGNLVIQTLVTVAGSYESSAFFGTYGETSNVSYAQFASTKNLSNFLPKMTVTYKDAATDPETETVTIWGTVTDNDGAPIEGVEATLTVAVTNEQGAPMMAPSNPMTYTATTDADGTFEMTDIELVEGATYVITLTKDGFKTYTSEDLALTEDSEFAFEMERESSVGIADINVDNVASVRYINAMGQSSTKPFDGVNMVVIEFKDGTKTTIKMVK